MNTRSNDGKITLEKRDLETIVYNLVFEVGGLRMRIENLEAEVQSSL